jgi:enamine deaminase RidA (YjgF/YER057c/UK114 family)
MSQDPTTTTPQSLRKVLQPAGWPRPRGYSNGIVARGTMIFVAGQIGWDTQEEVVDGFVPQARKALENIVAVLAEAGAKPEHIVRMTWFVTDMDVYQEDLAGLGQAYREVIGRHFPVMTAVEISRLDIPDAMVEIEATAVLPG